MARYLFVLGVVSLISGLGGCASTSRPSQVPPEPKAGLRWSADPSDASSVVVEVRGLGHAPDLAQAQRLLSVYADTKAADGTLPPMLGTYEADAGVVRFRPRFSLQPGLTYRAVLQAADRSPLTADYEVPSRRPGPPTVVSRVYPSGDIVPENLLKFYVHFSAPMSRGDVYQHIRLLDASGAAVELPFLELGEELWDPAMTRLTLFIDPGRIKRGVKPLEDIGPALEEGKEYTLVIALAWRDADGNELGQEFRKRFRVGPPDRDPPDPAKWVVTSPPAASKGPLAIAFGEPMDHALAERVLEVTGEGGNAVEGTAKLDEGERRWLFAPASPWRAGRYRVVVQPALEDLAGNNVGKPFEVELQQGDEPPGRVGPQPVVLPFEVR